jgi:hypothetical protein
MLTQHVILDEVRLARAPLTDSRGAALILPRLKNPHSPPVLSVMPLLFSVVLLLVVLRGDEPQLSNDRRAGDGPRDLACSLGERRAVEVDGEPLIVDSFAAFPALGDIDGDGQPDLLLGDPRGYLKIYRSVGKAGELRLAAPVPFGRFCDDERIPIG